LTVTATGVDKIYDGTTATTVTLSDNRFSGDVLTDQLHDGRLFRQDVANGISVNASGIAITGS